MILAIDPGPTKSAFVTYDELTGQVEKAEAQADNDNLMWLVKHPALNVDSVACEGLQCYGMPVGKETFETAYWIGRFWQATQDRDITFNLVFRSDIKLYLCNSARAKDPNVRQAIIDKFEPSGGGKVPQVGTKKQPGPLFGVSSHAWPALGVALYFASTLNAPKCPLG